MKIELLTTLKFFACLAFFLMFFPFIVVFNGLFLNYCSAGDCIIQQLFIVICGFLGYLFNFLFQSMRSRFPVRISLLFILTCFCSAGASIAFFLSQGSALSVFLGFLSTVSYISGNKLYDKNYGTIIPDYMFLAQIILDAAFIFILEKAGRPYYIELFIGNFICILLIYVIVDNQSNIDSLMERRSHKLENLPKNIRFYNMRLVLIVLSAVLLCFLLKDFIIIGINLILSALHEVFIIITGFFQMGADTGQDISYTQSSAAELTDTSRSNSSWTIMLAVFMVALVVLIVMKRKQIIRFIISSFQRLWEAISRRFPKLMKPKDQNKYYCDEEEYINPKEIRKQPNPQKRKEEWSKSCKKFYKMADTSEKVRFGYKLVIEGLSLCGLNLLKSNTTNEILDKSRGMIETEEYALATAGYNSVRYGNQLFNASTISDLNDTIQIIGKLISTRKVSAKIKILRPIPESK